MSAQYFNTLNYTLANEDTTLEMNVLPESAGHVVSVAGSGARVLPLFAKNPKRVTCVDLSREQLFLTELRIETARVLSLSDFLKFWGYPPDESDSEFRKKVLFNLGISEPCQSFFQSLLTENDWQPILYDGKWEKTFVKISKLCRSLLGRDADKFFESRQMSEHLQFMRSDFPDLRWKLLIFIIGNSTFFNALLYKGHFPKKNTSGTHSQYYKDAFDRIFSNGLPRENYFLQLTLLGKIAFAEGNPVECKPDVYQKIQLGLRNVKVDYTLANVVDFVSSQSEQPVDFVSLSDVPSYFDEQTANNFLVRMSTGLNADALVVSRYYLRVIDWMQREGFERVTEKYRQWIEIEKTQMYDVDIFRKLAK